MRSRPRFALLAPALLAAALTSALTRAGGAAPGAAAPLPSAQATAAQALFEQGRKALAEGDLVTACLRFRASDRIDPAPGTKANIADCEERRGHVATAWEMNRTALAGLAPGDARRAILERRVAKLEPRLPRLSLVLAPDAPRDTTVRDGEASIGVPGSYGVPLALDPGVHHLQVDAPGCAPASIDVTLTEGRTATVAIPACVLGARASRGTGAGPWALGGVGALALIAGGVTGGLALAKHAALSREGCVAGPPPTCASQAGIDAANQGRALGVVTTTMLVTGTAAVVGAGLWLGLGGASTPVRAALGATPSGGALQVEGTF